MTTYYEKNQLRANPSKTQVCAFHLRNREAKRDLNKVWNGTRLSNTTTPVYLGIHLDRTLCYKTHIEKTKMKVNARNNIIRKLANSKWGCKASTLKPSCLALCYSAAEYACSVWARSTHAHKLNPALHDCCRIISGCLKPTNLDSVHLLAGIAPPHIRRTVACRMERTRQMTGARHQLFHHQPAASRLKSRKSFMRTVTPLDSSASSSRLGLWKDSLTDVPASVKMGLEVAESLPVGSGEDWLCWRALNRLRTGVGRAKTVMRRLGYLDDAQSVDCDCGEPQTMGHLLSCRLLDEACTADDLATVRERAKACARKWEKIVWRTRKKKNVVIRVIRSDIENITDVRCGVIHSGCVIVSTSGSESFWDRPSWKPVWLQAVVVLFPSVFGGSCLASWIRLIGSLPSSSKQPVPFWRGCQAFCCMVREKHSCASWL